MLNDMQPCNVPMHVPCSARCIEQVKDGQSGLECVRQVKGRLAPPPCVSDLLYHVTAAWLLPAVGRVYRRETQGVTFQGDSPLFVGSHPTQSRQTGDCWGLLANMQRVPTYRRLVVRSPCLAAQLDAAMVGVQNLQVWRKGRFGHHRWRHIISGVLVWVWAVTTACCFTGRSLEREMRRCVWYCGSPVGIVHDRSGYVQLT
jgi:hypothetical protein